jgi:peptidoglycan/LPS O-acetylase OafA/YrhL
MTHGLVESVVVKVLPVARFAGDGWPVRAAVLAIYAVMIAVAAILTHLVVEKPARNLLRALRLPRRASDGEPVGTAAVEREPIPRR